MDGLNSLPLDDAIEVFHAARIAKVSPSTMRRWCEEKRVKAWKPVGRWRVERTSLYDLIGHACNLQDHHLSGPSREPIAKVTE